MRGHAPVAVVVAFAAALLLVSAAAAARAPTRAERQAITNALPKYVRASPVGCVWLNIRVSKNPRYAYVAAEIMNAVPPNTQCLRYASNGFYILKKSTSGKWRSSSTARCGHRVRGRSRSILCAAGRAR